MQKGDQFITNYPSDYGKDYYDSTAARIPAYLVGVILAFIWTDANRAAAEATAGSGEYSRKSVARWLVWSTAMAVDQRVLTTRVCFSGG
jgi:hypothetical protein